MNILMVLSTKKYPPDRRVEREAHALAAAGHNVYLIAVEGGPDEGGNCRGVHVIRTPLPFQKIKPIADTIYFTLSGTGFILRSCAVADTASRRCTYTTAVRFCCGSGGPAAENSVVFDMHEHYVEVLEDSFNTSVYRKYKPFSAPLWLMAQEEKYACRHSTKIIVIGNEHIGRLIPLGRKEQFVEVANTDDRNFSPRSRFRKRLSDNIKIQRSTHCCTSAALIRFADWIPLKPCLSSLRKFLMLGCFWSETAKVAGNWKN